MEKDVVALVWRLWCVFVCVCARERERRKRRKREGVGGDGDRDERRRRAASSSPPPLFCDAAARPTDLSSHQSCARETHTQTHTQQQHTQPPARTSKLKKTLSSSSSRPLLPRPPFLRHERERRAGRETPLQKRELALESLSLGGA